MNSRGAIRLSVGSTSTDPDEFLRNFNLSLQLLGSDNEHIEAPFILSLIDTTKRLANLQRRANLWMLFNNKQVCSMSPTQV